MKSLNDFQKAFEKKVAENKAREDAIRANPQLAKTPATKQLYRKQGLVMVFIGLIVGFATTVGALATGRILIIGASASLVFVVLGIWMAATGTNPLRRGNK